MGSDRPPDVLLDVRVDPHELQCLVDARERLAGQDGFDDASFVATIPVDLDAILGDARLSIGGVDLLGPALPDFGPWEPVWVVWFATDPIRRLADARRCGRAVHPLNIARPGGLEFAADGERCTVTRIDRHGARGRSAEAAVSDLATAWEALADRVSRELVAWLPELVDHEDYGRFFREGTSGLEGMWTGWAARE